MSIGICACGGVLRVHTVKKGTAYTCNGCGRYEVVPPKQKEASLEHLFVDIPTLTTS
jgi:hypothetical protein